MSTTDQTSQPLAIPFKEHFQAVMPLILDEWKQLQADDLAATEGELEFLVDYIAEQTDRTRTLIRRQLVELYQIARLEHSNQATNADSEQEAPNRLRDRLMPDIEKTMETLEKRAEKLLSQVETDLLPEISEKAKEKLGTSLMTAFGVGFILGLVFGGFGRGRS